MSTVLSALGLAHSPHRLAPWALATLLCGPLAPAQAEDVAGDMPPRLAPGAITPTLNAPANAGPLSSMWQRQADRVMRFRWGPARFDLSLATVNAAHPAARLFGDYYLTGPGFGSGQVEGGLRLTSGLALGRADAGLSPWAPGGRDLLAPGRDGPGAAQAYVGLGYSSLSLRAGWAFSADLGLGRWSDDDAFRLGQGGPSDSQVNRLLDDLRLSPVIQLGVRYAF